MNIVWKRPDGGISVTVLALKESHFNDLPAKKQKSLIAAEAKKLQDRGSIPPGSIKVAVMIELPRDRTFRNAWAWLDDRPGIDINMNKAAEITHEHRRAKRGEEFAPYDEIISKQIPGDDTTGAETARAGIRKKYDKIQTEINACKTPEELKSIITVLGETPPA